MTDFSSVNLRILSPDGKTVLAELQTIDRAGQRTSRGVAGAGKEAIADFGNHAARTSRRIAGELSMIAHEGAISARSLKSVAIEASNAAFAFGPAGVIAGAVALTGVAIFNMFKRTREEIELTARKAAEELRSLAHAGNLAGIGGKFGVATQLFSGDRFAVKAEGEDDRAFQARKIGIQGVEARIAALRARAAAATGGGALEQQRRQLSLNQIREWQIELDKLRPRYDALITLQQELADAEGFAATQTLEGLREKGDEARARVLKGLLDKRGMPGVGITGQPMSDLNMTEFGPAVLAGIQKSLKTTPALPANRITPEIERIAGIDEVADQIGNSFGQTLAQSIAAGINAGITSGSLGEGFRTITGAVLQAIGGMLIQIGVAALAGMQLIAAIKEAIMSFAPELGIPAALGLIALGAVLQSVGGGLGGGGSRSGGFGGGGTGRGQIIDRGLVNPLNGIVTSPGTIQQRSQNNYNITLIGPDDARAQRSFLELMDKAEARRG